MHRMDNSALLMSCCENIDAECQGKLSKKPESLNANTCPGYQRSAMEQLLLEPTCFHCHTKIFAANHIRHSEDEKSGGYDIDVALARCQSVRSA